MMYKFVDIEIDLILGYRNFFKNQYQFFAWFYEKWNKWMVVDKETEYVSIVEQFEGISFSPCLPKADGILYAFTDWVRRIHGS